jgi:hypothetical protein
MLLSVNKRKGKFFVDRVFWAAAVQRLRARAATPGNVRRAVGGGPPLAPRSQAQLWGVAGWHVYTQGTNIMCCCTPLGGAAARAHQATRHRHRPAPPGRPPAVQRVGVCFRVSWARPQRSLRVAACTQVTMRSVTAVVAGLVPKLPVPEPLKGSGAAPWRSKGLRPSLAPAPRRGAARAWGGGRAGALRAAHCVRSTSMSPASLTRTL